MALTIEIIPRAQLSGYLTRTERWACMVLHRRAGKSFACVQDLIARALTHKRDGPPLRYAYLAPTREQAKDIAFGYLSRFAAMIPNASINKADLAVTFDNGATIRLYSGEAFERIRGIYLDGIVLDEAADIDPTAWDNVIRPTLSDYQGWATWVGTPKGRDAFWKTWIRSCSEPGWFSLMLKASESGIIPADELADIKRSTPELAWQQEYECDFAIGRPGAIYAREIEQARATRRISNDVLWFRELPVYSSFDVGAPFNQRCWLWQAVGDRINFLEALSGDNECNTPAAWAARLREKRYSYGSHFIPHDAAAENGGLWQQALATAGLSHVVPVPRQRDVWYGINLALDAFPRVWFAADGCADGIASLEDYHAREERDGVSIGKVPVHNYASHYADAFSLAHQALHHGLVTDRTTIRRRPSGSVLVRTGLSTDRPVARR